MTDKLLKDKIECKTNDWDGSVYYLPKIEDMIGLTFDRVYQKDDDELVFEHPEGIFTFTHYQNCCEDVHIESVVGSLNDLCGTPLLMAEASTKEDESHEYEHATWTFYKFATIKGYVDIRWIGVSNGYYSEEVDLMFKPSEVKND